MIDKTSGIPVYKQIEIAIRTDIDRGIYKVGEKLPSEDALTIQHGASRGTVRQALSELASQGIVKRVHGNGTFICERGNEYKIENDHFISFLDGLESSGVHVDTYILDRKIVQADSFSREAFPGNPKLYEIRRIRKRDGKAIMMSSDYIPMDIAPGIEARYQNNKSIYDFLELHYSLRVSKVKRVFHAVSASGETAKLLSVKNGEPLFYIIQQAFDEYSRCVDYATLYIVSEGMQFSIISSR